jgi:osmotically-inducible protein OsmY
MVRVYGSHKNEAADGKGETDMKTNTELQKAVMEELAWEPSVDAAEIGVAAEDGIVTLSGEVKSFPEKRTAEKAAQRVNRVRAVTDHIVVTLPGHHHHSDTDIARNAANAMDWNVSIPHDRVKVLVRDGFITLDGTVDFYYQKVAAENGVRYLTGVRGVYNRLTVKTVVMAADVKHKIEKALERAVEKDAKQITVEVRDQKVILRGKVRTWMEREEAERAAWSAPGVAEVQSDIKIAA